MTVTTTATGVTHLAELDAASPTTNAFDALELSKGNEDTTALVDRGDATALLNPPGLVQVKAGYPKLDDDDPANPGRAADRWTWAFEVNGQQHGPFVASTGFITNYASGAPGPTEPVGFAWDDILAVGPHEVVTVYVNGKTGSAATVYYVSRDIEAETSMAATYTQRHSLLATSPGAHRIGPNDWHAEAVEGSQLYVMARALGEFAAPVTPEEVVSVRARLYAENLRTGKWVELIGDAGTFTVEEVVAPTPVVSDGRWPHPRGYNIGLWVDLAPAAPARRARVELDVRTERGPLDIPAIVVTIHPRAGRYSLT